MRAAKASYLLGTDFIYQTQNEQGASKWDSSRRTHKLQGQEEEDLQQHH